jgi:hypothetical protein
MYHTITATISQVELYLFSILVIGELPLSLVLFPKSWKIICYDILRGHPGRNRMVVGFTATYAINGYHH